MAKVWKFIGILAGIAILLGALCLLVGFITGGDQVRILNIFNATYDVEYYKSLIIETIQNVLGMQPLGGAV